MQSSATSKSKLHSAASTTGELSNLPRRLRTHTRIHEVNNNLMTIMAHCELMKSWTPAPEALKHLTAIRKAAASIAEIVGSKADSAPPAG